jgi:hypothetical protein
MNTLFLDVESSPTTAFTWRLFDATIPINHIVEPGKVICYSAKWRGDKKLYFDSVHKSSQNDMLEGIHELMSEADVLVHYNGLRYDLPVLNRDFLVCGLPPPPPVKSVDLYQVVKKKFSFVSNKLDWVCKQLNLGSKVSNRGMDLWRGCMANDAKAWVEMERYNRFDTVLLERLYEKLLPWIPAHPNHGLYDDSDRPVCSNCGSEKMQRRGYSVTTTQRYARYQCQGCGAWARDAVGLLDKGRRASIMRRIT